MEPNATYLKAKRNLVIASGILLIAVVIEVVKPTGQLLNAIPFELRRPSALNLILGVAVLYLCIQTVLFWSPQNDDVKKHYSYVADYVMSLAIGICSLIAAITSFFYPTYDATSNLQWGKTEFSLIILLSILISFLSLIPSDFLKRKRADKIASIEDKTITMLLSSRWEMIFNPNHPRGRKEISFNVDGTVGEGRNANEDRWRIVGSYLEFLTADNKLQSRFLYSDTSRAFIHTNDEDTISLRNQRIVKLN
jgi:hypothetical protein